MPHRVLHRGHNKSLIAISNEHEHLVELLDAFSHALKRKPINPDAITTALYDILEETSEHFTHEEELMLETGYPHYIRHQKTHEYILGLIKNLIAQHHAGKLGVESKANILIEQVMFTHFEKFDTDLVILISEKL